MFLAIHPFKKKSQIYFITSNKMEKIAKMSGSVAIIVLGIVAVGMAIYSLYQQSQLYPAVHQQIGYQACVNEVNAKVAEQQKAQQVAQPNE